MWSTHPVIDFLQFIRQPERSPNDFVSISPALELGHENNKVRTDWVMASGNFIRLSVIYSKPKLHCRYVVGGMVVVVRQQTEFLRNLMACTWYSVVLSYRIALLLYCCTWSVAALIIVRNELLKANYEFIVDGGEHHCINIPSRHPPLPLFALTLSHSLLY